MRFGVYGGFAIGRKPNRHGLFDGSFWQRVSDSPQEQGTKLAKACGCYIFGLKNGKNITAWYVGKTERRTFEQECFQPTKVNYYNEILIDHNGTPLLFLLPRLTKSGKLSKPTRRRYRDIEYLETMLIGMALEKNRKIFNLRKTKLLREMVVPGVINSLRGPPTSSQHDLKRALGLVK
jgi:hypothetical protein